MQRKAIKRELGHSLRSFLVELGLYAVLVVVYYFLVLHFLGDWLYRLFADERRTYAAVALGLILGQGLLLEAVTRVLLIFIKPRTQA